MSTPSVGTTTPVRITGLPPVGPLTGAEVLLYVQDGKTSQGVLSSLLAFLNPTASTTAAGRVELATAAETVTGDSASLSVTPAGFRSALLATAATLDSGGRLVVNGAAVGVGALPSEVVVSTELSEALATVRAYVDQQVASGAVGLGSAATRDVGDSPDDVVTNAPLSDLLAARQARNDATYQRQTIVVRTVDGVQRPFIDLAGPTNDDELAVLGFEPSTDGTIRPVLLPLDGSAPLPLALRTDSNTVQLSSVNVVTSQAAMLALSVGVGSVAKRTDTQPAPTTYMLRTLPASTLGNWELITDGVGLSPTEAAATYATKVDLAVTATDARVGRARFATDAETDAETLDTVGLTPLKLARRLAKIVKAASTAAAGLVQLATAQQVTDRTAGSAALTLDSLTPLLALTDAQSKVNDGLVTIVAIPTGDYALADADKGKLLRATGTGTTPCALTIPNTTALQIGHRTELDGAQRGFTITGATGVTLNPPGPLTVAPGNFAVITKTSSGGVRVAL